MASFMGTPTPELRGRARLVVALIALALLAVGAALIVAAEGATAWSIGSVLPSSTSTISSSRARRDTPRSTTSTPIIALPTS